MDFSLTTLFVVPVGQTALPSSGSTQDLTAGQLGFFRNDYSIANAGNIAAAPYFYVAQGRENSYLQGSKRSNKIKGGVGGNVTQWYKVTGCATAANQIIEISNFTVKCGEYVTLTLRAHSSYIDTLYFNGFTRSVTIQAPCCDCGADPCVNVDVPALIDQLIAKLREQAPGTNADNISFNTFYSFERIGTDETAKLVITGKPLTRYGNACDISAFPWEYDRMWFRAFIYEGPATTADFIVADSCELVADVETVQTSTFVTGSAAEIEQLEKNYYSYQAGYMKHLHRMVGYNQNFESYVDASKTYSSFYIKFNDLDAREMDNFTSNLKMDSMVIIACDSASAISSAMQTVLVAALGAVVDNNVCITTTTTTTAAPTTTTTTTV